MKRQLWASQAWEAVVQSLSLLWTHNCLVRDHGADRIHRCAGRNNEYRRDEPPWPFPAAARAVEPHAFCPLVRSPAPVPQGRRGLPARASLRTFGCRSGLCPAGAAS